MDRRIQAPRYPSIVSTAEWRQFLWYILLKISGRTKCSVQLGFQNRYNGWCRILVAVDKVHVWWVVWYMTSTEACSDFITEDCTRYHICSRPNFEICTTPRFWHSVPGSFSWLSAYFSAIIQLIIILCPLFTPVVSSSIDFGSCNCPQTMLMLMIDSALDPRSSKHIEFIWVDQNWCPIIHIVMDWPNRYV